MLKLYEVYSATDVDAEEGGHEKLACLDVTENNEEERAQILADLRTIYGTTCEYVDHDCGHDSGVGCRMKVV